MRWEHLLRPVLGPFSRAFEARLAIKRADQRFVHISQFVGETNERLSQYVAPGLMGFEGASLTAWSREGDDIVSSLRLKSLRKQEMIVPLRIKVGTDHVKIGDASLLLSDDEATLNAVARAVSDFFST
jgi:hypothetical protein